jgi:hypothetical protein
MITCHHVYYYLISRGLTLVSFSPMKHVLFIVRLPLDVGFKMDHEANTVIWHSDIDSVIY